jgi:hypothetical protein
VFDASAATSTQGTVTYFSHPGAGNDWFILTAGGVIAASTDIQLDAVKAPKSKPAGTGFKVVHKCVATVSGVVTASTTYADYPTSDVTIV